MNFEAVIGLEIHIELKTKSKMFSSAPNVYGALPNTKTIINDFAFPGTMPLVNKEAVRYAIQFAHALHMKIDHELHFDRKNYFYSDLPKGFQITQQERPIGSDGYLEITTDEGKRKIEIERIHLEEDTCKQLHIFDSTLLDYNRAGVPLIEVVSRPDIRNGLEAMKYVEKIKSIVTYLGISDGKMEEGSMRCDVNVSLRPCGETKLGTKVEIKNLNSTANVQKAIEFEMKRQAEVLLSGGTIQQETRRFDEPTKETVLMRVKGSAADYKYFPEPNIAPILLSDEFVNEAIASSNELADVKYERYIKLGLGEYDANQILMNKDIANYFDDALRLSKCSAKLLANWVIVDVQAILNKEEIEIKDFKVSALHLGELVNLIEQGKISNKQAREIFEVMLKNDEDPNEIAKKLGSSMVSDEGAIKELVLQVLDNNPQSIIDFKNGKDRALGYLVGQVMKLSRGKANPQMASKMVKEELLKR